VKASRAFWLLAAVGAFLLIGSPARAQQDREESVGFVYVMQPKPGMAQQFEQARKEHMAWHREHHDTWAWETWEVMTGPLTGDYLSLAGGHTWAQIEDWETKYGAEDEANANATMGPYLQSATGSIWRYLPDLSRSSPSNAPATMAEAIHFWLKPGTSPEFSATLKEINDAIQKEAWQPHQGYGWYSLVNGGPGPHWVLILPHHSWAEMAEPSVSFSEMLAKAYGAKRAKSILASFASMVARQESEILVYRPGLSYIPGKK
jgi:hypothetical protein